MQRGTNQEPCTPLNFSFGVYQPCSPQTPKSFGVGNIGFSDLLVPNQFKEEELQQMSELLNQRYGENRELLELVKRTEDSMMLSDCMNKCSFSSSPSFAMNSTQSTRELCPLEMSFEPIEKFELRKVDQEAQFLDPEVNEDCSIKDRLDSIRGHNFSNHRPGLDIYKLKDQVKFEDYSQEPTLLRRNATPKLITPEDCSSPEEADDT